MTNKRLWFFTHFVNANLNFSLNTIARSKKKLNINIDYKQMIKLEYLARLWL